MKCYYHNDRDAVATCSDCGKMLCTECASHYQPILCMDCARERIESSKSMFTKNIVLSVVLFIVGLILHISMNGFEPEAIATAYCFSSFPWGWSALNKITPNIFLFLPLVGWLIYFIIKGFLAVMIGWIAFPIKMFQSIKEIKRLNNMN